MEELSVIGDVSDKFLVKLYRPAAAFVQCRIVGKVGELLGC